MFVTAHALNRLTERLPRLKAEACIRMLEAWPGEQGTVAYIIGRTDAKAKAPDPSERDWHTSSNGDTIVAVATEGSVETVFYRRSSQDMSPEFFGAARVVDLLDAYTLRAPARVGL